MSDPFLEREKELMKLNESLNSKMSFDLKTPKAIHSKSNNKAKKLNANKATSTIRSVDVNQQQQQSSKNGTEEANKLKNDSFDVKKSVSNTYITEKLLCEKHELDSKDTAFNRNNNTNIDDAQKTCNESTNQTTDNNNKHESNERTINGNQLCDTLIETIEKTIDTKPTTNAQQLSLIPANMFRKNASAEGIIK